MFRKLFKIIDHAIFRTLYSLYGAGFISETFEKHFLVQFDNYQCYGVKTLVSKEASFCHKKGDFTIKNTLNIGFTYLSFLNVIRSIG